MRLSVKTVIFICLACLLLVVGILQWSWFHVDGSELALPAVLPEDCTGQVTVQTWDHQRHDADMTPQQIHQLLQLVQDSSYWRETSDTISGHWANTYFISLNYTQDGARQYVFFQICGDTAMLISGTSVFPKGYLMIRNDQWQETLDSIFSAP